LNEELEVQFDNLNVNKLSDIIMPQEAKLYILMDCLGVGDFSKLDGARIG
jgi:hypothetical protein